MLYNYRLIGNYQTVYILPCDLPKNMLCNINAHKCLRRSKKNSNFARLLWGHYALAY